MSISIAEFTPEHLPAVRRFAARYWSRPQSEDFLRWRYLDGLKFGPMYVGLKDGECVALVSSLRKRYLIAGERADCLEVFDWHCLPEFKGAGVGLRVMRAMMRRGEPLLAVGGTRDVLSTLPAMGWRRIGAARLFELPSSDAAVRDGLARRLPFAPGFAVAGLAALARAWFRPPRRTPPTGAAALKSPSDSDVLGLYGGDAGYDFVQTPDPDLLRWMASGFAGVGRFAAVHFTLDGRLRGWALTRLYGVKGELHAAIVEIFAPRPSVEIYTWMAAQAAWSLLPVGPRKIAARASCPALQEALRRCRFREDREDIPLHFLPAGAAGEIGRVHATLNHADGPLRPYSGE